MTPATRLLRNPSGLAAMSATTDSIWAMSAQNAAGGMFTRRSSSSLMIARAGSSMNSSMARTTAPMSPPGSEPASLHRACAASLTAVTAARDTSSNT